jgi:hypothetical protein
VVVMLVKIRPRGSWRSRGGETFFPRHGTPHPSCGGAVRGENVYGNR